MKPLRLAPGVALLLLAIVRSAESATADVGRYAVLVGIDDYSASQITAPANSSFRATDRPLPHLFGAVNDVRMMSEMLVSLYRFERRHIITLTNQQATRDAILHAIDSALIAPAQRDDVVFFYFAGHGSKVPNTASDEPDRMDETLVPADARLGAPDIRDKELRLRFNRVLDRRARLTVVLDACYSGSGVRKSLLVASQPRGVRPDERSVDDRTPLGSHPEDRGALIISASQDDGIAAELMDVDGQSHGAFSWAWFGALRDADSNEPVADTFLRARARLQIDIPQQEPVLAGTDPVRLAPFLGERADRRDGRTVVAVERVNADGTVALQGGWVNGIGAGSQLSVRGLRLEVVSAQGVTRCLARLVGKPAGRVKSGDLAEVVAWVAPRTAPMRLWIPKTASSPRLLAQSAEQIALQAVERRLQWIADPTEVAPDYILRTRGRSWELVSDSGPLGRSAIVDVLITKIPRGRSLYVQFPPPDGLVTAAREEAGFILAGEPEQADYVLCGRYAAKRLEYAWIRAGAAGGDERRLPLPVRTDWKDANASLAIRDAMLRLCRIHTWMTLLSPPGMQPPYTFAIYRAGDGAAVTDGTLIGGERYGVLLRPRPGASRQSNPRYVYLFSIDSHGRSVLVYPANTGSVENRVAAPRADTPLGPPDLFRTVEPYGIDTYFMLTSEEALPNPSIFNFDGVKSLNVRGETPLEQLLLQAIDPARGVRVIPTPPEWAIERIVFESIPGSIR